MSELRLHALKNKGDRAVKVAVCGVWHVHATDYTKEALALTHMMVLAYQNA